MKKVLITGFEAFGGETINPSFEAVKRLLPVISGAEIIKIEVPTLFVESTQYVIRQIKKYQPDIIIMVGQAGGRKEISVERVAINIDDSSIPDNRGIKPTDRVIFEDGDAAYFSTLPIKKIQDSLCESGIPVLISNSAGTYVCNHLMYGILYFLNKNSIHHIPCGFIHVPYIKEQILEKKPGFALDLKDIIKSLEIVIKISLEV